MTHKHCDRCCVIIKEPTFKKRLIWEPHYARLTYFATERSSDIQYTIDLCGKCMRELQKWLEED